MLKIIINQSIIWIEPYTYIHTRTHINHKIFKRVPLNAGSYTRKTQQIYVRTYYTYVDSHIFDKITDTKLTKLFRSARGPTTFSTPSLQSTLKHNQTDIDTIQCDTNSTYEYKIQKKNI